MTAIIKSWSSRNFSFAGRITLINSVLIAIQAYWSQMMIMPKKVLKAIEAICMAFLWKGQALFHGAGAVAWNNIFQPKSKMVALKDQIKSLTNHNGFQRKSYTIAAGYKLFLPPQRKLNWSNEVWARFNTPKHSVILWLAVLNRLKTKDKLLKYGMQAKMSSFRRKVLAAAIAALMYSIWKARNAVIWQQA
uniref:Reverse transcriptase zinc-binding domain-containing protein n=1 Tax=Cannabis sativa TaxID=3483 RepID=A0A803PI70_CANSA